MLHQALASAGTCCRTQMWTEWLIVRVSVCSLKTETSLVGHFTSINSLCFGRLLNHWLQKHQVVFQPAMARMLFQLAEELHTLQMQCSLGSGAADSQHCSRGTGTAWAQLDFCFLAAWTGKNLGGEVSCRVRLISVQGSPSCSEFRHLQLFSGCPQRGALCWEGVQGLTEVTHTVWQSPVWALATSERRWLSSKDPEWNIFRHLKEKAA